MEVMKALYSMDGGAPRGFSCDVETCRKVTRTQRGMWVHLRKKHRIRRQTQFVFDVFKPSEGTYLLEPAGERI